MSSDIVALAVAGALGEAVGGWQTSGPLLAQSGPRVVALVALGILILRSQHLYRASRASVRTAELTGIVRTSAMLGVASVLLDEVIGIDGRWTGAGATALTATVFLIASRGAYRAWLRAERSRGRFSRSVLLVGVNEDTSRIANVMADHPEAGFRLAGICGTIEDAQAVGMRADWRGSTSCAIDLVRRQEVTGVVVVASALAPGELDTLVREISDLGGHVHIAAGMRTIDASRITALPLAHEPLLHVQPKELSQYQAAGKRAIDLVLSVVALVVLSPILGLVSLAIKAADRGPVLFRQTRVGLDGRPFEVIKFRTMVVDAEDLLIDLVGDNDRSGPLFKLETDPRTTAFGRFLRATSLDELPQLVNVIRGEMSLVGPRPALPSEMEQFPTQLRARVRVLPGLTGLWQVEARDNPSFEAYERLDLFYVENWSPTFDLIIMLATVESEISRMISRVFNRFAGAAGDESSESSPNAVGVESLVPTLTD